MFFSSIANAMGVVQPAEAGQPNPLGAFLPLIIMFAIFYFLLIRPQQKKAKEHKEYLSNLKKGDYILTGGGIYGRIMEVNGDVLSVEISKDMLIKINRNFVSGPGEAPAKAGKGEKAEK